MNICKHIIIIGCFVFAIGLGLRASEAEPGVDLFNQGFSHQGVQYLLSVEQSPQGFDVFLSSEKMRKNLSLDFAGENLFPKVRIQGDHFYITWVLSKDKQVYGCYYDSSSGGSHMIPYEGFRFLSTPVVVFQGSQPRALVFLGNRGNEDNEKGDSNDNDDIFAYHLGSQRLVNITRTPENEKVFSVTEKNRGFSLHAETIPYKAVYKVRLPGLRVVSVEKFQEEIKPPHIPHAVTPTAYNTIVAFGDSITWGKIRMENLQGEYHPELAYLGVIQNILAQEYRPVDTVNLGISGDTTYAGVRRLHQDFSGIEGFFCLIMFGTNDVGQNSFSPTSSVENLQWICSQIKDEYGMYPIISTIPPMTHISGDQFLKENSETLNEKIIDMAVDNDIPYIDTYAAFFAQPDWEILVEDLIGNHVVGNHPSPAGHEVIAGLFLAEILKPPPQGPSDIRTFNMNPYRLMVEWTDNYEFDFSHYVLEFGYSADNLNRRAETSNDFFYFIRPPFEFSTPAYIYFRVRAEDKDGYSSDFSQIFTAEFE